MAQINSLKSLNRESADVSKSDLYSIAPHLILEQEGFNTRGMFCDNYWDLPDVKAGIRTLADAYLAGNYVEPMTVKVIDGNVYVREGHRRRRGLLLAISEGADIKKIQVLETKGDEAQQTLIIATSNDGLPLTPLEKAVIYGRLANWGWSDQEISRRVGKTAEHVRQARALLELPMDLKKMIQSNRISATYAAELFREHGDLAISMVMSVQQEGTRDANKVTRKSVERNKRPRIQKAIVEEMQRSFTAITKRLDSIKSDGDKFTITLSRDDVDALEALREKLAALEDDSVLRPDDTQQSLNLNSDNVH